MQELIIQYQECSDCLNAREVYFAPLVISVETNENLIIDIIKGLK